ncbi:hypothetical protein [Streptomyces sp. NPDC051016]
MKLLVDESSTKINLTSTSMSSRAPWMRISSSKPWSARAFSRRIPHRSAA